MKDAPTKAFSIGFGLVLAVFLPVAVSSVGWLFDCVIAPWVFPASLAVALAATAVASCSWQAPLAVLLWTALSILVSGLVYDYAYDSLSYHKPTVELLAHGWNPLGGQAPADTPIWTLHYAKLLETCEACLYAFTGVLEQAKAVNLMLAGSLAAVACDTLRRSGLRPGLTAAVIFVMLCNPVLSTQMPTFYIDYSLYVYIALTCLLVTNLACRRCPGLSWLFLVTVTVMAIGTKFNIFFYQGVALMAAAAWLLFRRRRRAAVYVLGAGALALLLGFVLFYHPYATNYLGWGNPLYPLLGEGSIDIMASNTPALYDGHGRIVNFFLNLVGWDPRLSPFTSYDSRVSGFTLLGLPILVFSLVILARGWRRFPKVVYYVAAVVIFSCFFFGQSWWARYIPQLWLLPVLAAFCQARYAGAHRHSRRMLYALVLMVACALLLSGVSQLASHVRHTLMAV